MKIKHIIATLIVLLSFSLSACGADSSSNTIEEVQTVAAATFQALTQQAANNPLPAVDTATATATATEVQPAANPATATATATPSSSGQVAPPIHVSVPVVPRGSFIPYPAADCERLRVSFEDTIGKPVTIESVAFSDRVSGGTGTACRIHGTGTGATYTMDVFSALVSLLPTLGWTEDSVNYGAGGPTGMATGFTKGGALGLLSVGWRPSADANCPKDQPIGMCPLTPEQRLFDVTFDVADMVVYNPPAADVCASILVAIQPVVPVPLVLETVDFTDFEMYRGTACQARAQGDGTKFTDYFGTAQALDQILVARGWELVNGADGPTGMAREYAYGNRLAVMTIQWKPAPGVICPQDQPISACPLTPEQRIYTLTIAFADK